MSLLDIQSIEILRGPQGTLFGKNAVGGIINIHRKKPQLGEMSGKVRTTAGNFGTRNIEGYFNLGGDKVALKLTGARLEHDGYYNNLTLRKEQDDRREVDYGGHFLWKPTDALTVELQGNHIGQKGTPNPVLNISEGRAVDGSGDAFCAFFGNALPGSASRSRAIHKSGSATASPTWSSTRIHTSRG